MIGTGLFILASSFVSAAIALSSASVVSHSKKNERRVIWGVAIFSIIVSLFLSFLSGHVIGGQIFG